MRFFEKVIFVGKNGTCREMMAAEILRRQELKREVEVLARGAVVLFPEPINQKAEAAMISNDIWPSEVSSEAIRNEDFAPDTIVITFGRELAETIANTHPNVQNLYVLTDLTGSELEVFDPYGQEVATYGMCFDVLRTEVEKLASVLDEGLVFADPTEEELAALEALRIAREEAKKEAESADTDEKSAE